MRLIKKLLPLVLCMCLLLTGCGIGGAQVKLSERGFIEMKSLLKDVTSPDEAYQLLQDALDEGKSLDLTGCSVSISRSLTVHDQNVFGGSIKYVGEDKGPVLKISGKCDISHVNLYNKCEGDGAGEGEYVGIWLSSDKGTVQSGTVINSVAFGDTGTCIYAPADIKAAACGMTVENIRAMGHFRGIDIRAEGCDNNRFSNIYIDFITNVAENKSAHEAKFVYKGVSAADCAFYLENCDNTTIEQLNVEHVNVNRPVVFENCNNLKVTTLHIEGVNTALDNHGYLNIANTSGRIGAITVLWSRNYNKNSSVIALGDAADGDSELEIENFHVRGINDPAAAAAEAEEANVVVRGIAQGVGATFKFISRSEQSKNKYFVTVNNYAPFTFQNDSARYESFVADTDTVTFKKIGQLPAGGTTAERPTLRLCAGYTRYYDTTLGQSLVWDGNNWSKEN